MCFLHPAFDFTSLIKVKSTLEDSLIRAVDQSVFFKCTDLQLKSLSSYLKYLWCRERDAVVICSPLFLFYFCIFLCLFFFWGGEGGEGSLLFHCFAQPESICATCQRAPCTNLAMQPFCRYQTVEDCSGVKNLLDHSVLTRCMVIMTTVVRSVIGFDCCWNCNQINKIGFSKLTCNIKMT